MSDTLDRPSENELWGDTSEQFSSAEIALSIVGITKSAILNKKLSKRGKVQKITQEIVNAYSLTIGGKTQQSDPTVLSAVNFAMLLWDRRKEPSVEIDLEVVTEELSRFEQISPIHLADTVRNADRLQEVTEIAALAVRMWVFDHLDVMTADTIAPSSFLKIREQAYRESGKYHHPGFP